MPEATCSHFVRKHYFIILFLMLSVWIWDCIWFVLLVIHAYYLEFLYGAYIGWPSEYELHKAQKCCHPYTGTVHFLKLNLKSQLGILSVSTMHEVYAYSDMHLVILIFCCSQLKPYVSQCPREVKTNEATEAAQSDTAK